MALALVVSAGCGDSDDDPAGAGTTTTTGAPEPTETTDPGEEEGEADDGEDEADGVGDDETEGAGNEDDDDPEGGDAPGDDDGSDPTDESPTTTEALPEDAVVYEAPIGNEEEDDSNVTVAESDDSIHRFAVDGLVVDCFPLGAGEQQTRTVDVTMEDVPVGEDRMVDHGEPGLPYSPVLSGLFTDDGELS